MTEILLHTKIGVPPKRSNVVDRAGLLGQANKELVHKGRFLRKLTLVSAAAGYGKTMMVSEWLHPFIPQVAWLSLDEADNDPHRFMAYLVAAIESIQPEFGRAVKGMIRSPQPPPVEVYLTVLLNEIQALPGLLFMVLDDYHSITNLAVHKQVAFLLDHLPACMHLVVITREDPLLSLSRLRASSQVLEIRQDDLRFTTSEISEFMLHIMHLDLPQGDILALERHTEGWIAGLQLAALSMAGLQDKDTFIKAFTGSNRFILDYLIEEVFNRQSDVLQDFLLKTAILDRFCGPLCDAVTGRSDSRLLLEKLEQANMFIVPLDQSRTWYRYHRLFSDLLRHQHHILAGEADESSLHLCASQWFESEEYTAEAIEHALAGNDWTRSARLIGQVNERMMVQGQVITLIGWLERLPAQLVRSEPGLCMVYAWALLLATRYDQAGQVLEQAEQLAQPGTVFMGEVASAQAYLARSTGDNAQVIEKSRLALSLVPETDHNSRCILLMNLGLVYWHEGNLVEAESVLLEAQEKAAQAGNIYAQLTSELFLARTMVSSGLLREPAEKYQAIIPRGPNLPVMALGYFDLGMLHYEWNDIDAAERYMQKGMEICQLTQNAEFQVAGVILQAYLSLARHDWNTAFYLANNASDLASEYSQQIQARCSACQVQVALAAGDIDKAARWFERATIEVDSHSSYRFLSLLRPRLLIAQGKKSLAAEILSTASTQAAAAGWGYALVAVRVLQALAADSRTEALGFLGEALRLGEPQGYIRTFIDAGENLIPLLEDAAQQGIMPGYIGTILAAEHKTLKAYKPGSTFLVEPLSERELEVLRLVAAGLTNREIANKLFISPGTVKTHIHNVCGKLGVRNRTEAAGHARALNLV